MRAIAHDTYGAADAPGVETRPATPARSERTVKTIGRSITGYQKAGGLAALFLAAAYLLAMPFFLLLVDYHSAVGPAAKVASLASNHGAMQVMYLITYVVFGIALAILALALYERLKPAAPALMQTATAVGLIWAVLLVASGLVFNAGMGAVVTLYPVEPGPGGVHVAGDRAGLGWPQLRRWRDPRRPVGSVGEHRGPSGGRVLSGAGLVRRDGRRHRARSMIPPLTDLAILFGLAQIGWFAWLGVTMLRPTERSEQPLPIKESFA